MAAQGERRRAVPAPCGQAPGPCGGSCGTAPEALRTDAAFAGRSGSPGPDLPDRSRRTARSTGVTMSVINTRPITMRFTAVAPFTQGPRSAAEPVYAGSCRSDCEVDLHAVSLSDRHRRKPVEKSAHDLEAGLRRPLGRAAGDDHRPVAGATCDTSRADPLRQARDKTDRGGGAKRGPIMLIHLVAKSRIADLIQAEELIEPLRASVWHDQAMKRHRQPRLSQRLNRPGFTEDACPCRNQNVLTAVGVHRVRNETIHGRASAAVEPVRQNGVDDGAFQQRVKRTGRADRFCALRRPVRTGPLRIAAVSVRSAPTDATVLFCGGPAVCRPVARTTASATSCSDGRSELPPRPPADAAPDAMSGRSFSGRRLRTTLLANRLSYSRRFRSAAIGS